jgi:molybdopterin/thiamine biosynthesis adenylyltransferase
LKNPRPYPQEEGFCFGLTSIDCSIWPRCLERTYLSDARVLIVGIGGLGVPAAWALARAGIRRLTLVDPDPVELSNLPRQVIYRESDLGQPKVDAAARRLHAMFRGMEIERHAFAFDSSNARALAAAHPVIIDATDDPAAKFLINDTAVALRRPFIYGGVLGMTGQAMTVVPGRSACLRCLFESPPPAGEIATCREAGIIGPVAGVIGEVQAAEAMALLHGGAVGLMNQILTYDASAGARIRVTRVTARAGCECGARQAAPAAADAPSYR